MPRRILAIALLLLIASFPFAPRASARQMRIDVANFSFTPSNPTLNQGDHVVWIWTGGFHSAVSGPGATPDGIFDSGAPGSSQTFSWKADRTGTLDYFCGFHGLSMVATLNLVASGASAGLSDFRITEVQYNVAGNADLVEITNLGATGDLGKYRLKVSGATVATLAIGASTNIAVPAGGKVVLHVGQTGTNTATDLFLNLAGGLPDAAGSVALYVPNTQVTALTNATQIIDYVGWGTGGQENEAVATTAALWSTSNAVGAVSPGSSIEFCGQPGQHGVTRWYENTTPNFGGAENCSTPTTTTTWGRLKTLYR
jgi:plastocyanin